MCVRSIHMNPNTFFRSCCLWFTFASDRTVCVYETSAVVIIFQAQWIVLSGRQYFVFFFSFAARAYTHRHSGRPHFLPFSPGNYTKRNFNVLVVFCVNIPVNRTFFTVSLVLCVAIFALSHTLKFSPDCNMAFWLLWNIKKKTNNEVRSM